MVCWEINTVTLEFKAKTPEYMIEVLKEMNLNPCYNERRNYIATKIGNFDLNTGLVETNSYNAKIINDFRVKYAEKILSVAAAKKKWVVKKVDARGRKFEVKKW